MLNLIYSLLFSDWVDLFQMLIALASSCLLFLTYKSQGKNDKLNLELSVLERQAKTASFIPTFSVEIKRKKFPEKLTRDGSLFTDYTIDETSEIYFNIIVGPNPLRITDFCISKNESLISAGISNINHGIDEIFLPGKEIECFITIPISRYFGRNFENNTDGDILDSKAISEKLQEHILGITINLEDMLENKYSAIISISSLSKLEISKFKKIENVD